MPEVTVALLGPREHAFQEQSISDDDDRKLTWDERDKVVLDVADDEPLGSLLKRAGTELGSTTPSHEGAPVPTFVAFDGDIFGPGRLGARAVLNVLDENGHARWNVPYQSIPYGDVVLAHDAGLLVGDPRRLYYVVFPGIGNGVIATWAIILLALNSAYAVMQVVSAVEGTIAFGGRVINAASERIQPGREALEANALKWEQRGGDQGAVRGMLGDRPWHTADAARLLGCSEAEAEAVLWAFGYARSEATELWRHNEDEAAQILSVTLQEIDTSYDLGHEDFDTTFRARLETFLRTGKRALTEYDKYELHDGKRIEEDPAAFGFDDDDDFDRDELHDERIPLDVVLVKCACGKPDCSCIAGFGIANGRLKIGFNGPSDHFVIDARYMEQIAAQVGDDLDEAKP